MRQSKKAQLDRVENTQNNGWITGIPRPWMIIPSSSIRKSDLIWLVVDLPLWKIWVRQLGWWHSQYMENKKWPKPPTSNEWINAHPFDQRTHTQKWLHQDQKMALKFAYQKVAVVLWKITLGGQTVAIASSALMSCMHVGCQRYIK